MLSNPEVTPVFGASFEARILVERPSDAQHTRFTELLADKIGGGRIKHTELPNKEGILYEFLETSTRNAGKVRDAIFNALDAAEIPLTQLVGRK